MKNKNTPLRKTTCSTCPFRKGSKYEYLKDELTRLSHQEGRLCHSTGSNNAINRRTGLKAHLCRGSRDVQLVFMSNVGVIEAPTDKAWDDKRVELGLKPTVIQDPVKEKRK